MIPVSTVKTLNLDILLKPGFFISIALNRRAETNVVGLGIAGATKADLQLSIETCST